MAPSTTTLFALPASGWQTLSTPARELPTDDPIGIDTFGRTGTTFDTIRRDIPFWAEELVGDEGALVPSNKHFPAWDVVSLAGEQLPGLCVVTGKQGKRFDVKKSKGSNFSTLTHQGQDPSEVKVVERIWTREQLHALWRIMPILQLSSASLPNGSIQAMEMRHPAVDLLGISAVVLRGLTLLHPTLTKGVFEMEYDLLEYHPRSTKNVTGTADGSAYTTPTRTLEGGPRAVPRATSASFLGLSGPIANTGPNGARGR